MSIPDPDLAVDYSADRIVTDTGGNKFPAPYPVGAGWRPPFYWSLDPVIPYTDADVGLWDNEYYYPDSEYALAPPTITDGADLGNGSDIWAVGAPNPKSGTACGYDPTYQESLDCCFSLPWILVKDCASGRFAAQASTYVWKWGAGVPGLTADYTGAFSGFGLTILAASEGGHGVGCAKLSLGNSGAHETGYSTVTLDDGTYYSLLGWYVAATQTATVVIYAYNATTGERSEIDRITVTMTDPLAWHETWSVTQHSPDLSGGGAMFWGSVAGFRLWRNWAPASDADIADALAWPAPAATRPIVGGTVETFADLAGACDGDWARWITIEGVGDSGGLWRLCERVPRFAAADSDYWKPWAKEIGDPLPVAHDARGGITRAGALAFTLLDAGSNLLTAALRVDSRPSTTLAAAIGPTDHAISVVSGTGIAVDDVRYLGREAVRVLAVDGTDLVVERAILDTEPEAHSVGELVYARIPYLEGRKVRLWYGAHEGRIGVPAPALAAVEPLEDARLDDLSMRLDDLTGDPVDSGPEGRDATGSSGLTLTSLGPLGPRWRYALMDSGSITLPKFAPTASSVFLAIAFKRSSWDAGTTQTLVAFSRSVSPGDLLTIRSPDANLGNRMSIAFMSDDADGFDTGVPVDTTDWHLLEVQVRDDDTVRTITVYIDGAAVHEYTSVADVSDASWTSGDANAPTIGSDDSGTAPWAGGLAALRICSRASGPYHAAERWRQFAAMTPATRHWGVFRLEPPGLSRDKLDWTMSAQSDLCGARQLLAQRQSDRFAVTRYDASTGVIGLRFADSGVFPGHWDDARMFLRIGGDGPVYRVQRHAGSDAIIEARGVGGTPVEAEIKVGSRGGIVYAADTSDPYSSFRYSPGPGLGDGAGPSASIGSGTWVHTAHWIPLMLIMMTSPADADDVVLGDGNFDPGIGNFSSLPGGVGIGYPFHRIDWDAWVDLWRRTPDYVFDGFALGDKAETFGELISREFLTPIGARLQEQDGLATIVLPRLPARGATLLALGPTSILARKVGTRRAELDLDISKANARTRRAIVYTVRDRSGAETTINMADSLLGTIYGQRRQALPFGAEAVSAPSVIAGSNGSVPWLERAAIRELFLTRRPSWTLKARTAFNLESLRSGDFAAFSDVMVPDLSSGARGVTDVPARIESIAPKVGPGRGPALEIDATMFASNMRLGLIAPSAAISSVASTTATVEANRYTEADGPSDLPRSDAAAFAVDDVVRLATRAGADASGSTQVVVSVGTNTIELDGTFGGALAAGLVLEYAERDDQIAQQSDDVVSAADAATRTAGTSDDPWQYGGD